MDSTLEREAKYHLEPGAAGPDLSRLPRDLVVVALPDTCLSARYWDTPGLDLLRHGMTLRHRHSAEGDGDLWTLKVPDAVPGVVLTRTELSWAGVAGTIPAEARRLLRATTATAGRLDPVATLVTVRRRHEVRDGRGRRLAEIDDDRVTVTEPTAMVFRQIEVELEAGSDDELIHRLAKLLHRAGARRSPDTPKLGLALGRQPRPVAIVHDKPTRRRLPAAPASGGTIGEALQATIARGLDSIVTQDLALRLDGGEETVHKARVASRRLRSDLKTFRPLLEKGATVHLSTELRWWAGVLGDVRDLDVLAVRIGGHAADAALEDQVGFSDLGRRVAERRRTAWARVLDALDGDRYLALLQALGAAVAAPPLRDRPGLAPTTPARVGAPRLVRRPWRRLRRAVRALPDRPSDAQLHGIRILAKQLRYASDVAVPIVGRPARRTAGAAADLQQVLGDQHDAVVAEAALRAIAGGASRRGALAAGIGIAAERRVQRRQRRSWGGAWAALEPGHGPRWLRA